ncbi:glycerophosphodiester phosphodiesterase family protein [Hyphobacterium sp. CCMP332]|uniref:glycerophosphodiester phosphodiesterase family protein n=1 Tax=Hyphobacterium sp. CCMP332 TaxID=2749086 RepID=UPI00164FCA01|nr:glycerophosphodiester phosphodiesterase family protein [Hyphobacterium sp. CCMP332]QNL19912.1 glycerophosphodiester phosphodiesterase family protein [Hyphobacterium sp. CCMP332]
MPLTSLVLAFALQTGPAMLPVADLLDCAREADATLVAVHRAGGFAPGIPENSLAGIRRAAELGAAFAEIDIRQTADGEYVLMHDATLDRTTTGEGDLNALTLTELRSLYLRDNGGRITVERIPTLMEALTLARESGIYLELDLKEMDPEQAARIVQGAGLAPYNLIIVYDVENAGPIQAISTEIGISLPFTDHYEVLNSELDFSGLISWVGRGVPNARTEAFLTGQTIETAMHDFPGEADGTIDYAFIDQMHVELLASDNPSEAVEAFGHYALYCRP